MDKNLVFEYFVFRLNEWKLKLEQENTNVPVLTKLRLQKILFLTCAWKADNTSRNLLKVFNHFYALPYGPIEMDIYEAMKNQVSFQHIHFDGNECIYDNLEESMFVTVSQEYRSLVDEAVNDFYQDHRPYLTMPVFDLVNLTHRWSAWKITMEIATFLGNKKEKMSMECICKSSIKAF